MSWSGQEGADSSHHQTDQAKYLATLYLEDLADLVQATIAPHFALSRYAESIAVQATSYDGLAEALAQPLSLTDEWMVKAMWGHIERYQPNRSWDFRFRSLGIFMALFAWGRSYVLEGGTSKSCLGVDMPIRNCEDCGTRVYLKFWISSRWMMANAPSSVYWNICRGNV